MDFPLPETPVTHVKVPKGIFKSTFFKLLPDAPLICKNLPFFANLLFFGIGIKYLEDKYFNFDSRTHEFGAMSCEMLAKEILKEFDCVYVSVFEDNENGAEIYTPDHIVLK